MFQIFSHWALTSPKVISFNTAVEATEKDLHVAPGGFFSSSERSSFHSATAGKSQFFVTYYRYMGRVHPFSIGLLEENQQDIELLRHQIRLVLLMVNHLLSQIRETVVGSDSHDKRGWNMKIHWATGGPCCEIQSVQNDGFPMLFKCPFPKRPCLLEETAIWVFLKICYPLIRWFINVIIVWLCVEIAI